MRVAHFVQRYPPALGGSEAYFGRLSRYLADQGDDVTVHTTNALDLEAFWGPCGRTIADGDIEEPRLGVTRFPLNARFRGRRYLMKALSFFPHRTWQCLTMACNPVSWEMWREAGRVSGCLDIVHATAFPYAWPIVCGLRTARREGVPFLLTPFLHLGDPDDPEDRTRRQYTSPALMSLIHAADRVFVQTVIERDALLQRGVPGDKLVLQGLGVDPAECTGGDRDRARSQWNAGPDEVVVGHLANLSAEKGSEDLLAAAECAWRRGQRFRLVLAGAEMPNFRRFWNERILSFSDRKTHLGRLNTEEKRNFFAGIDVFALPSRSDSFGLVLLEAWANGVPVVGYRAGGIAGVIQHKSDGLLVRCGDLPGLADALALLAADRALRQRLGQHGHDRISQEFRWEDKLQLVRRTYEELCRPHEPVSPTR